MTDTPSKSLAEIAYAAYAASLGGQAPDGRALPQWTDLSPRVKFAVADAALAVLIATTAGTSGPLSAIALERYRQRAQEGWTPEHDDEHVRGELAVAAACYALAGTPYLNDGPFPNADTHLWPFDARWFKVNLEDRRRNLEKAGALIAAELERLNRAEGRS